MGTLFVEEVVELPDFVANLELLPDGKTLLITQSKSNQPDNLSRFDLETTELQTIAEGRNLGLYALAVSQIDQKAFFRNGSADAFMLDLGD